MNVKELNQDQLSELKSDYFYNHLTEEEQYNLYCCYWEIPDDIIFNFYDGIDFVTDDFFCTAGNYEPSPDYDSSEDIEKCLNCKKEECTNCLKWVNGV
jgi:hypothetical protein